MFHYHKSALFNINRSVRCYKFCVDTVVRSGQAPYILSITLELRKPCSLFRQSFHIIQEFTALIIMKVFLQKVHALSNDIKEIVSLACCLVTLLSNTMSSCYQEWAAQNGFNLGNFGTNFVALGTLTSL